MFRPLLLDSSQAHGPMERYHAQLMRFLLALLAIVGLLVSPVAASAAQEACGHSEASIAAGADDAAMSVDAENAMANAGAPCCDHGARPHQGCAQACAATCAAIIVPALPAEFVLFAHARADLRPSAGVQPNPYRPPGLTRPPKPIA